MPLRGVLRTIKLKHKLEHVRMFTSLRSISSPMNMKGLLRQRKFWRRNWSASGLVQRSREMKFRVLSLGLTMYREIQFNADNLILNEQHCISIRYIDNRDAYLPAPSMLWDWHPLLSHQQSNIWRGLPLYIQGAASVGSSSSNTPC